jgi:hypothetical protein
VYGAAQAARWRLDNDHDYDGDDISLAFSIRDPDWYIGFSIEFVKSIESIDKSKRARILDAIQKIARAPTTPLGDTVKPLSGIWQACGAIGLEMTG